MSARRFPAVLLGCAMALTACADDSEEPTATSTEPSISWSAEPDTPTDSTPRESRRDQFGSEERDPASDETGFSLEEAEKLGVLTGTYDALFEGPTDVRAREGCTIVTLELRNVGKAADHYEITVEPPTATLEPAGVTLEAGAKTEVSVRSCDPMEALVVTAHSDGRGDIMAQVRL